MCAVRGTRRFRGGKSDAVLLRGCTADQKLCDGYHALQHPADKEKQFISELMEIRHDKCSTIFCSQYPSGDWYDKLHKSTLTEALLDRIIHNRIDVYMGNENFRIKK